MMFLLICLLSISFAQLSYTKQYRLDYTYHQKTDSFYKFHLENTYYLKAKHICEEEGGALFVPSHEEEIYHVHAMVFKQNPDIGNFVWIGVDAVHLDSAEIVPRITIIRSPNQETNNYLKNGLHKSSVMTRSGELASADPFNDLPFICKVAAKDVVYDPHCDIYIKGYEYYENVGSCYKIPRLMYSWNEAYDECWSHGAHLVVLNSELEHRVVHNLTFNSPSALCAQEDCGLFAGIRAEKKTDGSPVVFKTIFNQTLTEAGYDEWSENKLHYAFYSRYCGTIKKYNGKYYNVGCTLDYGFICEKNINK